MATGNSKTKWKRNDTIKTDSFLSGSDMSLNYYGKASEVEVLKTKPADITAVWSGNSPVNGRLYFGDNLPILAALLQDAQIKNKASSNPGDLVLDCFSGSGTTLAVADRLGRKWLGIDNSAEAITTTLRRFAVGADRMGDYVPKQQAPDCGGSVQTSMLELLDADTAASGAGAHAPVRDFSIHTDTQHQAVLADIIQPWISLTE